MLGQTGSAPSLLRDKKPNDHLICELLGRVQICTEEFVFGWSANRHSNSQVQRHKPSVVEIFVCHPSDPPSTGFTCVRMLKEFRVIRMHDDIRHGLIQGTMYPIRKCLIGPKLQGKRSYFTELCRKIRRLPDSSLDLVESWSRPHRLLHLQPAGFEKAKCRQRCERDRIGGAISGYRVRASVIASSYLRRQQQDTDWADTCAVAKINDHALLQHQCAKAQFAKKPVEGIHHLSTEIQHRRRN